MSLVDQDVQSSINAPAAQPDQLRLLLIYGAYVTLAASLLFADFGRGIAGLKPGELLLVLLAGGVVLRRLLRHDGSFTVTPVDAGFLLLIAAGTFLPLITLELRGVYITRDIVRSLLGPLQYYIWYRVFLDIVPLPSRFPELARIILGTIAIISVIGILQYLHIHIVVAALLKYYPSANLLSSLTVHRPTSVVGGWEVLASLNMYSLLLINQLMTLRGQAETVFGRRWNLYLIGIALVSAVTLILCLSFAAFISIAFGYLVAWAFNRRLARTTLYTFAAGAVALLAIIPVFLGRLRGHDSIAQTWVDRFTHWRIVGAVLTDSWQHLVFGVQPSFTYPVSTFNSTESMYLLLLYRGGIIYLAAFIAFLVLTIMYLIRLRRGTTGFLRTALTGLLTLLIVNAFIDIFDAHFYDAGESQLLLTFLAAAVGLAQHSDVTATVQRPAIRPGWMTLSRPIQVAVTLLLLGSILTAGLAWRENHRMTPTATPLTVLALRPSPIGRHSAISDENLAIGTFAWQLDAGVDTTYLQGYAGRASALPGETVPLYISSVAPISYDLDVYRIGWYRGWGGRLLASQHGLQSQTQGYWTEQDGLKDCTTCLINDKTHLIDAHWQASYQLSIGNDWPSGVYLVKLTATSGVSTGAGAESYIPLVVRGTDANTTMLVNIPVNGWQARNDWGGYSLYGHNSTDMTVDQPDRATAVSFNRPYVLDAGAGDLLDWDIHSIRWLERASMDVSYTTNVDIDADPASMLTHHSFISIGHDAYWTKSIRDGIQAMVNKSLPLAFMGAQSGYWQARLDADAAGVRGRTLVCYKVATKATDPSMRLSADPLYPAQSSLVTAQWSDPVVNKPETTLIGSEFAGYVATGAPAEWIAPTILDYFEKLVYNAKLKPSEHLQAGFVSGALDRPVASPIKPLESMGTTTALSVSGATITAGTALFAEPSGVQIFLSGSLGWSWALDDFSAPGASTPNTVRGNQQISDLMAVLMHFDCLCQE